MANLIVSTYGNLIPGANASYVDRLDKKSTSNADATPQLSATPAQPSEMEGTRISLEIIDLIGGGGQNRTVDLRVMSPSL